MFYHFKTTQEYQIHGYNTTKKNLLPDQFLILNWRLKSLRLSSGTHKKAKDSDEAHSSRELDFKKLILAKNADLTVV